MKYENTFKAIDQILWKEPGCGSELDYLEQKSWNTATRTDSLEYKKSKVDRLQENYDKISQECDALKQALLREVFEG